HGGAESHDRHQLDSGDAERQHRSRMMMAHGVYIGPRLVDLAVNDALAIRKNIAGRHLFGIERELQDVAGLDQLRTARARQQVVVGVGRMPHADMAESVEHALVGDDAIGKRKGVAGFIERTRHWASFWLGTLPHSSCPRTKHLSRPSTTFLPRSSIDADARD